MGEKVNPAKEHKQSKPDKSACKTCKKNDKKNEPAEEQQTMFTCKINVPETKVRRTLTTLIGLNSCQG